MEKNAIKGLLTRFLENQTSPEELQQVLGILRQAEPDADLQELMDEVWERLRLYPEVEAQLSDRMFASIASRANLSPRQKRQPKPAVRRASWAALRVAAMFGGFLLLLGLGYRLMLHNPEVVHRAGYGEMATITLPDASVVKLNGNSSLRYRERWNSDIPREVWLEGEAFFSVVHTQNHQRFLVHTADEMSVEVLGTTFSVLRRQDKTRVVLNTGKIRLSLKGEEQAEQLILTPGELVEFEQEPTAYTKKVVNPSGFSSWTENKLVFDATPLAEVVRILRDNYGLDVEVADPALLEKKLWGSTPSGDASVLLVALANSFGLQVEEKEGKVRITEERKNEERKN